MIDPATLRRSADAVKQMIDARAVKYDVDALIESDRRRRELILDTEKMRAEKNSVGQEISRQKKSGHSTKDLLARMRKTSSSLEELERKRASAEKEYSLLAHSLPNMLDESVPIGDESANREVGRWGEAPSLGFEPKSHVDLLQERDFADIERAARAAGARFYYLKGDLVRLNLAIIRYAVDYLARRGYTPVQPPYMINRRSMEGATIAEDFEDVIYKIEGEDLYLIGTSEHAVAAMHAGEILEGSSLPLRYAGLSPCFRKEAGAHGRDQKGIFRVHQFEKVEQFVFARPEDSWAEHERMLETALEFYTSLGIPHRTVLLSSQDMGKTAAKTYDIEAWMAGQGAYREVVSCSNCLGFQARRLAIRFRDRTNEQTEHVHTLNCTLAATPRVMVSILENMQTSESRIRIPGPLQEYMGADHI